MESLRSVRASRRENGSNLSSTGTSLTPKSTWISTIRLARRSFSRQVGPVYRKNVPLRVLTPGIYYARLTLQGNYPKRVGLYRRPEDQEKCGAGQTDVDFWQKEGDAAAGAGGSSRAPGPQEPQEHGGAPGMGRSARNGRSVRMGGARLNGRVSSDGCDARHGRLPADGNAAGRNAANSMGMGMQPGMQGRSRWTGGAVEPVAPGGGGRRWWRRSSGHSRRRDRPGRIVQSTVEEGKRILYLDKGSKPSCASVCRASFCKGKEGGQKLDGGTFTIPKFSGTARRLARRTTASRSVATTVS